MSEQKSIKALVDSDKKWLCDYMNNNPGAEEIDNYIFAVSTLKEGFNCALGSRCDLLQKDCKNRDSEESRLYLLCFSCDRIFHQRCSKTKEEDLVNDKTPWICGECIADPLNQHATEFFKSGRQNLTLKMRLEKYTTAVELPSPTNINNMSSFFEMPVIEQSLHVDFKNLELIDVSRILGTKLMHQQGEFATLRDAFIESEKEKKNLRDQLAQKTAENEARDIKMQQLEKTMNERLFMQDSKLQSFTCNPSTSGVRQAPPSLSSTMVMSHTSHQNAINVLECEDAQPSSNALRQSHADNTATKAKLLNQTSYSIKVLSANDVLAQISRELNQQTESHPQNASQHPFTSTNVSNTLQKNSSYVLPIVENHDEGLSLKDIRKCLPKIEKFDGSIDKWLTFERAVERNIREGRYCDSLAKNLIRQALSGQPLERVDSIYNFSSATEIMNYLRESYGCSMNIVASARKKLLAVKLAKPLTHPSVMEITTKITSYMSACKYAQLPILDMSISMHIHQQLDSIHQQQYYRYFYDKHPGSTRLERLDVQFEFLNELSKTLPMSEVKNLEKRESTNKNFQVFSTSVTSTKSGSDSRPSFSRFQSRDSKKDRDDFKYEIRSKETAPYIGYDMDKVQSLQKKCEICGKLSHFSLECNNYRSMPMDQRYNVVKTKGLCSNCLLTTEHQSKDCNLKLGCGFSIDFSSKCSQKHHITLHRGKYNSTPNNRNRKFRERFSSFSETKEETDLQVPAEPQTPSAPPSEQSSSSQTTQPQQQDSQQRSSQYRGYGCSTVSLTDFNEISSKGYTLLSLNSKDERESSQRTTKLFRTYIHGVDKKAYGFALGDSAAEVTLVKLDLIKDLGIKGEPCYVELSWTDSLVKYSPALKVNLKISGILPDSEVLEINECYAVTDLNLPLRTLQTDKLKKRFPYLRGIPFDSYYDVAPCILIGSRDAHMIEAVEPVKQNGSGKPVGLKSKLGYTIYGGATECYQQKSLTLQPIVVNESEDKMSNEQLDYNCAYNFSIESLGIKHVDSRFAKEEPEAIDCLDEEMKIPPDGSPVWRKANGEIPKIPNNYPMGLKRTLALENKGLIDDGYLRAATEKDINNNWKNESYFPITPVVNENKQPIKTRLVYDVSARYQGTSLNDNSFTGPNLLVNMLHPLMRMRMNKIAFTADVKSMFHRIGICLRDPQFQRILWREFFEIFIQESMQSIRLSDKDIEQKRSVNKLANFSLQKLSAALDMLIREIKMNFIILILNASVLLIYAWYSINYSVLILSGLESLISMNFRLGKNKGINKAGKAELENRQTFPRTRDNFYAIVQISPVPDQYKLSQVLLEITPYVKDAIGIMRVADYKAKRLGETIFIYFPFRQSAQYLETIKLDINNTLISPCVVSMKVGRASFIDKDFSASFDGVPITVMLKGVDRKQEAPIYYLLEMCRYFEKKGVVTGMRLSYDEKRDWTLNYGYVTFLRQADARQVGGEGGYIEHTIQQKQIRATLSENIPMLVAMEDSNILESGIVKWDQQAEALNQLIITYEWPAYLNNDKRVDNKQLLKDLNDKYHQKYPGMDNSKSSKKSRKGHKVVATMREVSSDEEEETPAKIAKKADDSIAARWSRILDAEIGESSKNLERASTKSAENTPAEQGNKTKEAQKIPVDVDEDVLQINLDTDITDQT